MIILIDYQDGLSKYLIVILMNIKNQVTESKFIMQMSLNGYSKGVEISKLEI